MRMWGTRAALVATASVGVIAGGAPAAARSPDPVQPVLGDWEGGGPHGLRLSFEFVRRAGHVVVVHLALGLPTGCRTEGNPAWDVSATPEAEYVAPGSVLHGPFAPLGATQFELILGPTTAAPFPVIMQGSFSNSRRGALAIPAPRLRCAQGGWPRTLRFTLAAARRVAVADGLWTGTVPGPPGSTAGTLLIRVIDGGRIETDIRASYPCSPPAGGSAHFEIGPLPTTGFLIAADGSIGGKIGATTVWTGRFAAGGLLAGNLTPFDCGSFSAPYAFTASRTGP